jgi:S-layer homology domain.
MIITIFVLFGLLYTPLKPVNATTNDYSRHWAVKTINLWISAGLAKLFPDGTFKPNETITRAELISYIVKVFNYTEKSVSKYTDVKGNAWYAAEMAKAVAASLIIPDSKGRLRPEDKISKQEAAIIITRAFGLKAKNPNASDKFTDYLKFPSWSKESINAMADYGYIKGNPDGSFGYAKNISRAEAITMINNTMGELKNKAGTYTGNFSGNLVINTPDVVLKDLIVTGDLYLTQGIADGNIAMDGVIVKGKTYVYGGGEHSIIINDSSLKDFVVSKKDGKIRIIAKGSTEITKLLLNSGAILEEKDKTGRGFCDLEVPATMISGQEIKLNGDFANIDIDAFGTNIQLLGCQVDNFNISDKASGTKVMFSEDSTAASFTANATTEVTGKGAITKAVITTSGVSLEMKPATLEIDNGYTVIVGGTEITKPYKDPIVIVPADSITSSGYVISVPPVSGNPTPPPGNTVPTSTISGIINADKGFPDITQAGIQLMKDGNAIGTPVHPDVNGAYIITGVSPGTYSITAYLSGYISVSVPVFSVTAGDSISGKNLCLNAILTTISGTITVNTGTPDMTKAQIQLKNNGTCICPTINPASNGTYTIQDVAPGNYTIDIMLDGYSNLITPNILVIGIPIIGKDVFLTEVIPTTPGSLSLSHSKAVPGEIKSFIALYHIRDTFVNGTIIFNIPKEFAATTSDKAYKMSDSIGSPLETQISNEGRTVTITGVNSKINDLIYFSLINKVIPSEGTYSFSATGDADGDLTIKIPSSGTGTETAIFTSALGPVYDLYATAGNGQVNFMFSSLADADNVMLEQSTDGSNFTTATTAKIDKIAGTAALTELVNGTVYYFRLNVTGGNHNGISNIVSTSPTLVDSNKSLRTIEPAFTSNTTSTVTITMKDSSGNPITTPDACKLLFSVSPNISFYINSTCYTGYINNILILLQPDINGISKFTITLPDISGSSLIFQLSGTNNMPIGPGIIYTGQ